MRQDESRISVEIVDDLHVVVVPACVLYDTGYALEFARGRGDEHDLGGEDLLRGVEPVRARDRQRTRRQEEEFVHGLEDCAVGVEGEDSRVLGLVESEEFGEGLCPGFLSVQRGEVSWGRIWGEERRKRTVVRRTRLHCYGG